MRGHIARPYPLRFVPCVFIARRFQLFLPSSTRVELFSPTLGALSSWSFFYFCKKNKISPRRDSNSRTSTRSIRGLPLIHRGDRTYIPGICLVYVWWPLNADTILIIRPILYGWYQPAEIYTHVRYVPPVDAHVWGQLHLSAVARCSDSYCISYI